MNRILLCWPNMRVVKAVTHLKGMKSLERCIINLDWLVMSWKEEDTLQI